MNIKKQLEQEKLRCVRTHATLIQQGNHLSTADGKESYDFYQGAVPILFRDTATAISLGATDTPMAKEYTKPSLYQRIRNRFYKDYNCYHYDNIFADMLKKYDDSTLFLSIGGGPLRRAPHITNINIGTYPNVDIVCDAHELCYHNDTVDAIFCDVVLEHLHSPIKAVQEMQRVLKKGGQVLSVVPFMQAYHGYPHHYQNYTLTGHELLYRSQGFEVLDSGACQGPVVTMTTLCTRFCLEYLPRGLNIVIGRSVQAIGIMLRPLDRLLEKHPKRYVLASTTFVLARKL